MNTSEERTAARLKESEERLANVVAGEVGTIHSELRSINDRLVLQAGLIQSGARAIARFSKYSESSEARWVDLIRRVTNLERRMGSGQ